MTREALVPAAARRALGRGTILLMLTLSGFACADEDGGARHGSLHGTVRDGSSGKRLKGVQVTFLADTLERASDKSDGEGRFVLQVVALTPTGRLTAEKSGYETRTVSVFLDDADVNVDIELEPR